MLRFRMLGIKMRDSSSLKNQIRDFLIEGDFCSKMVFLILSVNGLVISVLLFLARVPL